MPTVIKFNSINEFIDELSEEKIGCIVDTNFMIACLHTSHPFYDNSIACFEILAKKGLPIFSTHTIRSEFLDVQRKYILTKKIVDLYDGKGRWEGRVQKRLRQFLKPYADSIKESNDSFYLLPDQALKDIKMNFFPRDESGKIGWTNFCEEFLSSDIQRFWDQASEEMNLNYIEIREEESKDEESLISDKIEWKNMLSIVGSTGIATNDAMIINVFNCSKFPLLITTDLDVVYSILNSKTDKTVAIPDSMLKRHNKLFNKLIDRKNNNNVKLYC